MSERQYQLIFRGQLAPGHDIDEVKRRFAKMYGMNTTKVERRFFSGKPVVIKKVSTSKQP